MKLPAVRILPCGGFDIPGLEGWLARLAGEGLRYSTSIGPAVCFERMEPKQVQVYLVRICAFIFAPYYILLYAFPSASLLDQLVHSFLACTGNTLVGRDHYSFYLIFFVQVGNGNKHLYSGAVGVCYDSVLLFEHIPVYLRYNQFFRRVHSPACGVVHYIATCLCKHGRIFFGCIASGGEYGQNRFFGNTLFRGDDSVFFAFESYLLAGTRPVAPTTATFIFCYFVKLLICRSIFRRLSVPHRLPHL